MKHEIAIQLLRAAVAAAVMLIVLMVAVHLTANSAARTAQAPGALTPTPTPTPTASPVTQYYTANNPILIIPDTRVNFATNPPSVITGAQVDNDGRKPEELNTDVFNAFDRLHLTVTDALAGAIDPAKWCSTNRNGIIVAWAYDKNGSHLDFTTYGVDYYRVTLHWQVNACDGSIVHPAIQTAHDLAQDKPLTTGQARANVHIPLDLLTALAGLYNVLRHNYPIPAQQAASYSQAFGAINTFKTSFIDKHFDYQHESFISAARTLVADYCYGKNVGCNRPPP